MMKSTIERSTPEFLRPTEKPKVMDLVRDAGLDVSQWAEYARSPAANPRFCYEWCFEQEGLFVFNIWFDEIESENERLFQHHNMRRAAKEETDPRRRRAINFDAAARKAFELGSPVRAIVLDKPSGKEGGATARRLDKAPWTVTEYDYASGEFTLARGLHPTKAAFRPETQENFYVEGQLVEKHILHRRREAKLREEKIRDHLHAHGGRLICEVPGCGFDFEKVYGKLGEKYAQVHHLTPLASLDGDGGQVYLSGLAIVCANCHAMIHRGGECRELASLIPGAA